MINSIGNLSGFIGPYLTGYLFNVTGSYTPGFLVIAALVGAGGLGMVLMLERRVGQIAPQGWEFYAITATLFLTLGFPGFVYRYLVKRRQ